VLPGEEVPAYSALTAAFSKTRQSQAPPFSVISLGSTQLEFAFWTPERWERQQEQRRQRPLRPHRARPGPAVRQRDSGARRTCRKARRGLCRWRHGEAARRAGAAAQPEQEAEEAPEGVRGGAPLLRQVSAGGRGFPRGGQGKARLRRPRLPREEAPLSGGAPPLGPRRDWRGAGCLARGLRQPAGKGLPGRLAGLTLSACGSGRVVLRAGGARGPEPTRGGQAGSRPRGPCLVPTPAN